MKTTLVLNDALLQKLRTEAARQGRTMSELVESALQLMFGSQKLPSKKPPRLPSFNMGPAKVDISDRDALYRAMEEEK